jgi:hypothetical protein
MQRLRGIRARREVELIDGREWIEQAPLRRLVPEHEGVIVHGQLSNCSTVQ